MHGCRGAGAASAAGPFPRAGPARWPVSWPIFLRASIAAVAQQPAPAASQGLRPLRHRSSAGQVGAHAGREGRQQFQPPPLARLQPLGGGGRPEEPAQRGDGGSGVLVEPQLQDDARRVVGEKHGAEAVVGIGRVVNGPPPAFGYDRQPRLRGEINRRKAVQKSIAEKLCRVISAAASTASGRTFTGTEHRMSAPAGCTPAGSARRGGG